MYVEIISYTHGASEICAIAANSCYSDKPAHEINLTVDKITNILDKTIESGHHSVLEHAIYTFSISGVSRVLTHQLVRHRMASYSQQSQRYVKTDELDYITPPSIMEKKDYINDFDVKIGDMFDSMIQYACDTYNNLIELGIPQEDARYVLPGACTTNIVVTMNARELMHFFELRLCDRAQWEIRELADKMLDICMDIDPQIFKHAGPSCKNGVCKEANPCGNPYKR